METFRKRPGTTDYGSNYEILTIANFVVNLVTDEDTKNFFLSANEDQYGSFDDIVVEIESHQGTTSTIALRLVHSQKNRALVKGHLEAKNGNFSLQKCFHSFQSTQNLPDKLILYTNCKLNVSNNTTLKLDDKEFTVELSNTSSPQTGLSILDESKDCFKLSIIDETDTLSPKILQYKMFFEKFRLYTNQKNLDQLGPILADKFQKTFCANKSEYSNFLKIIEQWNLQTGVKEKLSKKWAQHAIALQILSSRIHPLSFDLKVGDPPKDEKEIIMREAISAFDITVFEEQSYERLKTLWSDYKHAIIDSREVKQMIRRYQICSSLSVDDLNSKEWSELLWLMGKCPLIVTPDESVYKALELCPNEKFVLLEEAFESDHIKSGPIFRNLYALKIVSSAIYEYFVQKFTCSLQGRTPISLKTLTNGDEKYLQMIKSDNLLKMMDEPLAIGDQRQFLSAPYIQRHLSQNVIDLKYLERVEDETIVIIDGVKDKNEIKNWLKRQDLNYTDVCDEDATLTLLPIIFFSDDIVSSKNFEDFYNKHQIKNCHQFRVTDDYNLILIRSTGDLSDLELYKLDQRQVQEDILWSSQPENNISLITGDSGSGKSELLKSVKNNSRSKFWIAIVTPEDVYSFLKYVKDKADLTNAFRKFLVNTKCEKKDRDLMQLFLEQNDVIYLWDAIDEISNEYLGKVIDLIVTLRQYTRAQLITSRCHLKTLLEQKFKVFALALMPINEEDQEFYIKTRLAEFASEETIFKLIENVRSSFLYKDILGVPLLIHMFTEVVLRNADKYSSQMSHFNMNTLYHYFIEEKMNLYFTDKMNVQRGNFLLDEMVLQFKQTILDFFEKMALKVMFPEKNFEPIDDTLIKKNFELTLGIGLITNIQNQAPRFCHDSFAAYFAALYFSKHLEKTKTIIDKFFNPQYSTMRLFFDSMLARDCLPHLAVISNSFDLLSEYGDKVSTCKDAGGRTALHLACSRGRRHPTLEIKENHGTFIVNVSGPVTVKPESPEYVKMVDYLLERCDVSERDGLFKMTPLHYAHKSECLKEELMIIRKQDKKFWRLYRNVDYVISALYYSAALGYIEPFDVDRLGIYNKRNILNVKDKSDMSLSLIASQSGHRQIVDFFEKNEADIKKLGDYKRKSWWRSVASSIDLMFNQ